MSRGALCGPSAAPRLAGNRAGLLWQRLTAVVCVMRALPADLPAAAGAGQGIHYNGITDCFKQILKQEGMSGL